MGLDVSGQGFKLSRWISSSKPPTLEYKLTPPPHSLQETPASLPSCYQESYASLWLVQPTRVAHHTRQRWINLQISLLMLPVENLCRNNTLFAQSYIFNLMQIQFLVCLVTQQRVFFKMTFSIRASQSSSVEALSINAQLTKLSSNRPPFLWSGSHETVL